MAKALASPPDLAVIKQSVTNSSRTIQALSAHWRASTLGLLSNAVRQKGWSFIPRHVLPPLFANGACGAVLFTVYEGVQPRFERDWRERQRHKQLRKRMQDQSYSASIPMPTSTYVMAGAMAGAVHAVVATPLDAVQVRLEVRDFLMGRFSGFMDFARSTAKELGAGGLYRGFLFTLIKDVLGYSVFFGVFDSAKSYLRERKRQRVQGDKNDPHWSSDVFLGTAAVLASGAAAGAAYQLIDHPLDRIRSAVMIHHTGENTVGFYATAWRRCQRLAYRAGGWQAWLYQGLTTNLIKAVPATSLGLFCYEWM
jgi:hypothetical protein